MDEKEKYVNDHFFNAEKEPEYKGSDAFGYALYEGDEVYVYENNERKYLLISKMNAGQKAMAKLLELEREVL
ncbi:hypothetical protein ACX2QB_08680 [Weissella viridescens]